MEENKKFRAGFIEADFMQYVEKPGIYLIPSSIFGIGEDERVNSLCRESEPIGPILDGMTFEELQQAGRNIWWRSHDVCGEKIRRRIHRDIGRNRQASPHDRGMSRKGPV